MFYFFPRSSGTFPAIMAATGVAAAASTIIFSLSNKLTIALDIHKSSTVI